MSDHAKLAPSSAARWVICPGSVALSERYPRIEESSSAMEGTAAHWVASELFVNCHVFEGTPAPNGVTVTEEMIEGAQLYADHVNITVGGEIRHIEKRVNCPSIHAENWGTPDCWAALPSNLHVWDYKFGHTFVDAFENWQMINYVSGILTHLGEWMSDHMVHMHVVQPRSYHKMGPIRTWSIPLRSLAPYFERLKLAANMALMPGALCVVSKECKHCDGRHACEALQRSAMYAADAAYESTPLDLPIAAMSYELRTLKEAHERLGARISGMEEIVMADLKGGKQVPGFVLEQGKGREKWAKPIEEVLALGRMCEIDISKPGALTPKQAIKAGLPEALVRSYSETPNGEVKLVVDDGSMVRNAFGNS